MGAQPSSCSSSTSAQQLDRAVVERFTDEPCRMPRRIRAAFEQRLQGETIRLYALGERRQRSGTTPEWVALSESFVAFAGDPPPPGLLPGSGRDERRDVCCLMNSLGNPLVIVSDLRLAPTAVAGAQGGILCGPHSRARNLPPPRCEQNELGWEAEVQVRVFERNCVTAVSARRGLRRGSFAVTTSGPRQGVVALAYRRWQQGAFDNIRVALEHELADRRAFVVGSDPDLVYVASIASAVRERGNVWRALSNLFIREPNPSRFG